MKTLYYIKGNTERSDEVIKTLLEKYPEAQNLFKIMGDDIHKIYYVQSNKIQECYDSTDTAHVIRTYGTELFLPEEPKVLSWVDNGKNKGVRVHVGYYDFVIDPKNLSDRDICWRTAMIKAKKQDKVLPSKNELMLMYIFRDRINKYLKNNKGDELSSKSVYWCSENFSSDIGWYISFLNGFTSYNFECSAYSGRAITHFKY